MAAPFIENSTFHSLIFILAFLCGVAVASTVSRLEVPNGFQQFQTFLLGPHKDGTERVREAIASSAPWSTLGRFLLGVARCICLADHSWDILVTWTNHNGWDLSTWRSVSTFRTSLISQLSTVVNCHTVNSSQNPISAACTRNSVSHYPRIRIMLLIVWVRQRKKITTLQYL